MASLEASKGMLCSQLLIILASTSILCLIRKSLVSNKLLVGTTMSESPCNKKTLVFDLILFERLVLLIIFPENPTIQLNFWIDVNPMFMLNMQP